MDGYESAVAMPIVDLFDNSMMQQYIAAAREQYKEAEAERKEFYKNYGDFYSPSQSDTKNYFEQTLGGASKLIAEAQANGIDLFRSPEGRALVSQYINTRPYARLANYKQSAENLKTYNKMVATAKSNGTYDEDFEKFVLGGKNPNDWNSDRDGVWDVLSPTKYETLKAATQSWFDKRTPHTLSKQDVESFGQTYDPKYDYTGFTQQDLMDIAGSNTPGWIDSTIAKYYRNVAKNELINSGIANPSAKQINQRLQQNIARANEEFKISPVRTTNDYAKMDVQNQYEIAKDARNFQYSLALQREKAKSDAKVAVAKEKAKKGAATGGELLYYTDAAATNSRVKSQSIAEQHYNNKAGTIAGAMNYWQRLYEQTLNGASYNDIKDPKVKAKAKEYYDHYKWWEKAKNGDKATLNQLYYISKKDNRSIYDRAQSYAWSTSASAKGSDIKTEINKKWGEYANNQQTGQSLVTSEIDMSTGPKTKGYWSNNKYSPVSFATGGIGYSPVMQSKALGGRLFTYNSIESKFDRYLKKSGATGFLVHGTTDTAVIAGNRYISATPSFKYSVLKDFYDKYGEDKGITQIASQLGVKIVHTDGTEVSNSELRNANDSNTIVYIPITRAKKNNGSLNDADLNQKDLKDRGGNKYLIDNAPATQIYSRME